MCKDGGQAEFKVVIALIMNKKLYFAPSIFVTRVTESEEGKVS